MKSFDTIVVGAGHIRCPVHGLEDSAADGQALRGHDAEGVVPHGRGFAGLDAAQDRMIVGPRRDDAARALAAAATYEGAIEQMAAAIVDEGDRRAFVQIATAPLAGSDTATAKTAKAARAIQIIT